MGRYAQSTEVSTARSRTQVEGLLHSHNAEGFAYAWDRGSHRIEFVIENRNVRFVLPPLEESEYRFSPAGRERSKTQLQKAVDQADRQRWRCLYLVVRAKLEAIESGLAIFEQEFLAFIVQPNGKTIGDILVPQLKKGDRLMLNAKP